MSRNLFESLNFCNIIDNSNVIDLTSDGDESEDDDQLLYPDTFSSDIGQLLNDQSISAVLSNVEIFYKSQLELLNGDRYEKHELSNFIDLEEVNEENLDISIEGGTKDESKIIPQNFKASAKQTFSSYYFLKQTFNCPMVLIDHLIDSLISIDLKTEDAASTELSQQIEIDSGIENYRSGLVTKRDLRIVSQYEAPRVKKPRVNAGRPKKSKNGATKRITVSRRVTTESEIEVIELIDSGDEMEEVDRSDNSGLCES